MTTDSQMTSIPSHFRIQFHPLPDPEAVVRAPEARFTLLTPRMIRMEYQPAEAFEDRPSQVFWYRDQAVPEFEVVRSDGSLEIITEYLHLRYVPGRGFSPETLSVRVKESGVTWRYGDVDHRNLGGTARTLDEAEGRVPLEPGLVSRAGWVVVNDSSSLVFDEAGWLERRDAPTGALDLYFLGYGHAYQDCLADFCRVAGPVPVLPRWVLGNWWSRYWRYTQQELGDLMLDFEANQVPLSVCIVDMDWHLTDTGNACSGWTGYTWNRDLFPDPPGFIRFLHGLGLKTALNLHPAEGIHSHEAMYPQMAEAVGIDPASRRPVRFDIEDPTFAKAYFELLHHPLEAQGVDFWWVDWQQGNPSRLPGLNLLWWINHLHFHDLGRDGQKRPFLFSRWGGLGNHRYPIGFSGDTVVSWKSLAFQPHFTAVAANVGYGWWSHDIGGHMDGVEDPELYTRWVQYGVFSPIFRLHSTQNPYHERHPWGYDAETFRVTRQAMQLRHALIPYLYTMAWYNHRDSVPPIRPMYYLDPEAEEAYACPNQYTFGSELLAAPLVTPHDADTRLSRQMVWLPEGDWFDFFSGQHLPGGGWHAVYGELEDIPVFARAGAIVPLGPVQGWGGVTNPDALTIFVFPGAANRFELYEDDGISTAYLRGSYAVTPFVQEWREDELTFRIGPAEGEIGLVPEERKYTLVFRGVHEPGHVEVTVNGDSHATDWSYDPELHTLTLAQVTLAPADTLVVRLQTDMGSLVCREDGRLAILQKMLKTFRLGTEAKSSIASRLVELISDPGLLATYQAVLTRSQLRAMFETLTGAGVEHITNTEEELIVLWNNDENPDVTFLLSVEVLHVYTSSERYHLERGALPRSQVYRPAEDFSIYPAVVQVSYYDSLKIVITHQMDDSYPRPQGGLF
jgi:alpha-glucosidase (family GH31 glycosyl hydrolase)